MPNPSAETRLDVLEAADRIREAMLAKRNAEADISSQFVSADQVVRAAARLHDAEIELHSALTVAHEISHRAPDGAGRVEHLG